jgi:hypothetical protein
MSDLDETVRQTTDALDALGNTTAATGKGFAIGSAVLTALSLLTAFKEKAGVVDVNISDPIVLSGILVGAMLPFLFAALTMLSVQKVRVLRHLNASSSNNPLLTKYTFLFVCNTNNRPPARSSSKCAGSLPKFPVCARAPPMRIPTSVWRFRRKVR